VAVLNDHYDLLRTDKAWSNIDEFSRLKKPELARIFKYVKQTYHPPVSSMSAQSVLRYVWATEASLGWNWPAAVSSAPAKKRVSKACRENDGAVSGGTVPANLLPKPRKARKQQDSDLSLNFLKKPAKKKKKKKPKGWNPLTMEPTDLDDYDFKSVPKKKRKKMATVPDDDDSEDDDIHLEPDSPPPAPRKRKKMDPRARIVSSDGGMDFVAAPSKRRTKPKAAAAAPRKATAIRKGAKLTAEQRQQIQSYSGKANRNSLRLYMLRGMTVAWDDSARSHPRDCRAAAERTGTCSAPDQAQGS